MQCKSPQCIPFTQHIHSSKYLLLIANDTHLNRYAGIANAEIPDVNVTSLRYGFGFGLAIIIWLVSAAMTFWVWKTATLIPASAYVIEDDEELGGKALIDA